MGRTRLLLKNSINLCLPETRTTGALEFSLVTGQQGADLIEDPCYIPARACVIVPHQTEDQRLAASGRDITGKRICLGKRTGFRAHIVSGGGFTHATGKGAVHGAYRERVAERGKVRMRGHKLEQARRCSRRDKLVARQARSVAK